MGNDNLQNKTLVEGTPELSKRGKRIVDMTKAILQRVASVFNYQNISITENDNLQNETLDVYEKIKETRPELRTAKELSEGIRQDIRCVGLVPEGMQVEGMPKLSKQEIEDIKSVSDEPFDYFEPDAFSSLLPERRTEAVSQAAVNSYVNHFYNVPETAITDKLIWTALPQNGYIINTIQENRRTLKMCMTALETYGSALKYFPPEMITPQIAMEAVQ